MTWMFREKNPIFGLKLSQEQEEGIQMVQWRVSLPPVESQGETKATGQLGGS